MNLIFKKQLPRRTFLRGMGSVVALPLLDAMVPAFVQSRRLVADAPCDSVFPERRPDGHLGHQERRADRRAPGRAASHAGAFEQVSQRHHGAEWPDRRRRPGAWRRSGRSWPRGRELSHRRASQEDVRQGSPGRRLDGSDTRRSVIGSQTRFASLELGCEEGIQGGNCDNGYSCAYSNSISWRTPSTPNPPEIRPRAVFERLFGTADVERDPVKRARNEKYQKSVLDSVLQDAKRLETSGQRLRSPQAR